MDSPVKQNLLNTEAGASLDKAHFYLKAAIHKFRSLSAMDDKKPVDELLELALSELRHVIP